jgi:hypothetical protein
MSGNIRDTEDTHPKNTGTRARGEIDDGTTDGDGRKH